MVIAFKALLFLFAGQSYQVLQNQRLAGVRAWFEIWNRWDSINYQKLAEFGYNARDEMRPRLVFYPLYPWAVRLFAFITHDYLISAFIVSTIASLATAILFYRLVSLEYSKDWPSAPSGSCLFFPPAISCTSVIRKACFLCSLLAQCFRRASSNGCSRASWAH